MSKRAPQPSPVFNATPIFVKLYAAEGVQIVYDTLLHSKGPAAANAYLKTHFRPVATIQEVRAARPRLGQAR